MAGSLDLDDVAATSETAKVELASLRGFLVASHKPSTNQPKPTSKERGRDEMKIETDYIKREAQKECYWLQGGTFDLVTWTQAMMQNAADRAGSKIRQLEVALRIKTEEHDCCAADLIQWRKSAESAIGENAELRADADEFRKYLKDGESILGRLSRYNKEVEQLMRMFAAERMAKERLRDALNEILCLDTGRLGDAYVIAGFALSQKPSARAQLVESQGSY